MESYANIDINKHNFYKDINFLNVRDNVELIRNVQIKYCPHFIEKTIKPIFLEELYIDEIYFDPLEIYFFTDNIHEYIHISPFTLVVNGELFYIPTYEAILPKIKTMLYLTCEGITDDIANTDRLVFNTGRLYWLLLRNSQNTFSVLTC